MVIKLPGQLKHAIKVLGKAADAGHLKYVGEGRMGTPFASIRSGSGWGDIVQNCFVCSKCFQKIMLFAETYHGSGGGIRYVNSFTD